jgi:archaetidylinositol phosphate synthase
MPIIRRKIVIKALRVGLLGLTPPTMKPVERIQENFLAKHERRLLNWLCARVPAWMTPDVLTAIGFAGAMISAAGYVLSNQNPNWLWIAVAGYFINWFGDSLDGSVARYRKIERPNFGYFIDHSADALSTSILLACIGLSPFIRLDVMLIVLVCYLLLSIHSFLAAKVVDEFRLSYVGAGPTELRLLLIAITITMYAFGPMASPFARFTVFDIFVLGFSAILLLLFIIQTLQTAKKIGNR